MFDTTASDRVQVRSQGELSHPGACALCGSGNCEEGYIDLGIYYDYEGQMYLCMTSCVKQVITVAGGLPIEESGYLKEQCLNLIFENEALKSELEKANELIAQWQSVVSSLGNAVVAPSVVSGAIIGSIVEDASQASEQSEGTESGSVGEDAKPAKPVEGKRPPKPSNSAKLNDSGFAI